MDDFDKSDVNACIQYAIKHAKAKSGKKNIKKRIDEVIRELEFAVEHNEGIKRDCYQRSLNLVRQKLKS